MDAFTPEVRKAIEAGVADGVTAMRETEARHEVRVNGWQIAARYGALMARRDVYRAGWTFFGVRRQLARGMGRLTPLANATAITSRLTARTGTDCHFTKGEIPPVDAFWSLTMYDDDAYLVANPINRYALGDRSHLAFDADGGLTLLAIQSWDSPGEKKGEQLAAGRRRTPGSSWRCGSMRQRKEVADGAWAPPSVKSVS